jgi:hypothetical protein
VTPATKQTISGQIEKMIDGNSLVEILEIVSHVCTEKADHVRTNWQDEDLSNAWGQAADIILDAVDEIGDLPIPH